jgi:hypothetical protein
VGSWSCFGVPDSASRGKLGPSPSDFEAAQRNGLLEADPTIAYHYCLFHYVQMLRRRVKKLRLRHLYYNDAFVELFNALCVLPYLPVGEVMAGCGELFRRFGGAQAQFTARDLEKIRRESAVRSLICWQPDNLDDSPRFRLPRLLPQQFHVPSWKRR